MAPERDDAANSGGSRGVRAKQNDQHPNGNSRRAQQQRLLDHLRKHGSIDTVTARRETDHGRTHSVALYTLLAEPRQGVLL